jgi:hypothetical protein
MKATLPKFGACAVVDVTTRVREGPAQWDQAEQAGITILMFWTIYRRMTAHVQIRDLEGALEDANWVLNFPSSCQRYYNNIPAPYEIVCFYYRAQAHMAGREDWISW